MAAPVLRNARTRVDRFRQREDFRANPVKALLKRGYYKVRSRVSSKPWTLLLDDQFRVTAPIISTPATAIFYLGASEPSTLRLFKSLIRPGMTVVDVGAHIGEYALVASRLVGESGRVYAFEPGERIFPFLRDNLTANGARNAQAYQMAVSDLDGELTFNLGADPGHSRLVVGDRGSTGLSSLGIVTVPSTTLNGFAEREGVGVHVLKIDVEGAELSVLEGASSLLSRQGTEAPAILFEYLARTWSEYGRTIEEGVALLEGFGYRVFGHLPDGELYPLPATGSVAVTDDELDLMLVALKPEHLERYDLNVVELWTNRAG